MKRLRDALAGLACVCLGSCYFALLFLTNIGRPRLRGPYDAWVITSARLLPRSATAITFGHLVFCKRRLPSLQTLRHEMMHVTQYRFYGWIGFLWRYGVDIARHGYDGSTMETAARLAAYQEFGQ